MARTVALLACYVTVVVDQVPAPRPLRPATDSIPVEFNRIVGMRELPDGTLLVSDAGDRRLVVIDFKSQTLQQIGREGRGPGEYGVPTQFYALAGDSLLRRPFELVCCLGVLLFPLFVLQSLVYHVSVVVRTWTGLAHTTAISLCIAVVVAIAVGPIRRVHKLYYG